MHTSFLAKKISLIGYTGIQEANAQVWYYGWVDDIKHYQMNDHWKTYFLGMNKMFIPNLLEKNNLQGPLNQVFDSE
jgi:hypothetical protein